ncbi:MAG: MMPL family transporter [Planctomycetes bacterium]|nr:MMPL family transporter [Planctomycetota bacterium]
MNLYQRAIARGWWLFLLAFIGAAAWAGWRLPHLAVEASTDVLLDEHDGDLAYYNLSRAEWQTDEYLVVCCHRKEGWFTPEGLALLIEFIHAVRKVPYAKNLTAITTVPLLRNQPATMFPTPVTLEGKDGKLDPKANLAKARQELVEHTQARGNLISENAQDTIVLVYLDVGEESIALEKQRNRLMGTPGEAAKKELEIVEPKYQLEAKEVRRRRGVFVERMRELQAEWGPKFGDDVRISGVPFINVLLMEHIRSDMTKFGALALGVFVLTYLVIYRRARWVALPIVTCLFPVVMLCALMVTVDRPITVVTANMPVLLFVLMLPYTVYYIERWLERRTADPSEPGEVSATRAPVEIWPPCAFSCLAAMAGTAAHIPSGINPVRTFGWVMTALLGVGLATVMLLLPSAVAPLHPASATRPPSASRFGLPLRFLQMLVLRVPLLVVVFSLAILGVSIWGTSKVTAETKFIDYFWPTSPIHQGLSYIDTRMSGTTPLEVILTSEKKGFFKTKEGLAALEAVARFFDRVPETGNVRSFKTLVDEVRKCQPKNAKHEAVVNLVNTFAKDQVAEFCNADFTVARVLVRMRETAPTLNRDRILKELRAYLDSLKEAELKGLHVRPTGVFLLYSNMLNSIIKATRETFILAVASIWIMLWILFRSPFLATLVLLPQVLPVFLVLGVMGFTGIALDMVTVIIASVAMGVGIDAAIQYAVRYRRELDACGDPREAVRRSHSTIGRAILIATSIMFAGFGILMLSNFRPTFWFGMFTGLAILMGLFASLTTLPAMFVLLNYPRARTPQTAAAESQKPEARS